jgi:uncharacterized protein with PIN domain
VSDILKILDQVPIWRAMTQLPKRVQALEEKLAALEARLAASPPQAAAPAQPCRYCGERALRLTSSERSKRPSGRLGARDEVWTCSACGRWEEREGVK